MHDPEGQTGREGACVADREGGGHPRLGRLSLRASRQALVMYFQGSICSVLQEDWSMCFQSVAGHTCMILCALGPDIYLFPPAF